MVCSICNETICFDWHVVYLLFPFAFMIITSCIRHAMIHKLHQSIAYCYNILQHVSWDKSCFHEITFIIIIVPTLPPYPPSLPDPKRRTSWLLSQQPHMQIQLQTYTIVATTNDNLYVKYELYRQSRSFTISLFVLHCTPLYHFSRSIHIIFPVKEPDHHFVSKLAYIQFNT